MEAIARSPGRSSLIRYCSSSEAVARSPRRAIAPADGDVARVGWRILGAMQSSRRAPQTAEYVAKRKPAADEAVSLWALARLRFSGDQQASGRLLLQRRCGCLAGPADTAAFRLVLAYEQGRC